MADTKAHPVQNGNGNGNGKVRELIMWILSLTIPLLIAAIAAIYSTQAAQGERIKGCEVAGAGVEKRLDALDGKLDKVLEYLRK